MSSFETSSLKALQYLQALHCENGPSLHFHQQLCWLWEHSLFLAPSPHHCQPNNICDIHRHIHPLRSSSSRDPFLEGLGFGLHLVPIYQHLGMGFARKYANWCRDSALFTHLSTGLGPLWLPYVSYLGWHHYQRIDEMVGLAGRDDGGICLQTRPRLQSAER